MNFNGKISKDGVTVANVSGFFQNHSRPGGVQDWRGRFSTSAELVVGAEYDLLANGRAGKVLIEQVAQGVVHFRVNSGLP